MEWVNGFLNLCTIHNLVITNTIFKLKDKYKNSWKHPRSGHWHLIDYIIVRQRDLKDVLITRAMRGAECWTDHRLIRSKMRICMKPRYRNTNHKTENIDYSCLKISEKQADFEKMFEEEINKDNINSIHCTNVESTWETLKNILKKVCKTICGSKKRKTPDWFRENETFICPLLEEKRTLLEKMLSNPQNIIFERDFKNIKSKVQRTTRYLKNKWWINKSNEINELVNKHDSKAFFDALKITYGPTYNNLNCPVKDENGSILTTSIEIKKNGRNILNHF